MIKIINRLLPRSAKLQMQEQFLRALEEKRRRIDQQIPKPRLKSTHIRNCQLLLDRCELLEKLPSSGRVAELGVDHGDFSEHILGITGPEKLHLVDNWGSDRYDDELYELVKKKFGRQIDSQQIEIHRKLSTDAGEDFAESYFDWVYIDTDHSYETTKAELNLYAPKVKPAGFIAGHDYVKGNWATGLRYGVIEAVHEFCIEHDWELVFLTTVVTEFNSFAIRRIQA